MSELYSTDIITLAQDLRDGFIANPAASVRRVSKLCGSEVDVDMVVRDGVVAEFAQRVRACALGQAAAAILGRHAVGASCEEIAEAHEALHAMLKLDGDGPEGRFADLRMLKSVRGYPARHQSVMLAFEAAREACRLAQTT